MDRAAAVESSRQIWRHPNRKKSTFFNGLLGAVFLLNSAFYLFPWPPESLIRWFMALVFVGSAVMMGTSAVHAWQSGIQADAEGLRITKLSKATTIAWEDVARIKGNVRAPYTTRVIIMTTSSKEISVELAEGHQELLDLWAAVEATQSAT